MGDKTLQRNRAKRNNDNANTEHVTKTTKFLRSLIRYTTFLCSLFALSLLIYGFYLRISLLHNGSECDMTYSMYKYLPIQLSSSYSSSSPNHYRLLKFADRRDPRYIHLYNYKSEYSTDDSTRLLTAKDDWCAHDTNHQVLYIPGHWGSYTQSRSLGAHGLHLTRSNTDYDFVRRVQHQLQQSVSNKEEEEKDVPFFYDVYTVDFHGQGGALHGYTMLQQTHFVCQALQTIHRECSPHRNKNNNKVTIVAHSIGGLVARAIPILYPESSSIIANIITLATPHQTLPYMFDETLYHFYNLIHRDSAYLDSKATTTTEEEIQKEEEKNNVFVLSISGGLRDELIPPSLCHTVDATAAATISVLATTIMPPKQYQQQKDIIYRLGMDHRAIVWCHNVLHVVREIIQGTTLFDNNHNDDNEDAEEKRKVGSSSTTKKKKEWITRVLKERYAQNSGSRGNKEKENMIHYKDELLEQENFLVKSYGLLQALAMKIAMPYNLSSLVRLYTLTALVDQTMAFISWYYQKTTASLPQQQCHLNTPFSLLFSFSTCVTMIITTFVREVMVAWIYGYDGSSNSTAVDTISSVILCFLASILYFGIANGIPVLVSRLYLLSRRKCRRETKTREENTNSTMSSLSKCGVQNSNRIQCSIMTKQLFWFAMTVLIVTGGSYFYVGNIKDEEFIINTESTMAIILLSIMIVIVCNILLLMVHPPLSDRPDFLSVLEEKEKLKPYQTEKMMLHLNKRKNRAVALLLPTMPFLMTGKVIYAFSMLTTNGQIDLEVLDNFHAALGINAGIFHHDQFRFVTVCLPIFFLICIIRHTVAALGTARTSQFGTEKQLDYLIRISRSVAGKSAITTVTFVKHILLCLHFLILTSFFMNTLEMGTEYLIGIAISASSLLQVAEYLLKIL